jgi:hypothetical protein
MQEPGELTPPGLGLFLHGCMFGNVSGKNGFDGVIGSRRNEI